MQAGSSSSAGQYCLAVNDKATSVTAASEEFLKHAPRGAYTTARTVAADTVFELSFHVRRLAESATLMINADEQAGQPAALTATQRQQVGDEAWLRPRVVDAMRAALHRFRALHGEAQGQELKLTLLLTWQRQQEQSKEPSQGQGQQEGGGAPDALSVAWMTLYCHVQPLPPRPTPPVTVEVRGAPRSNPLAKDSAWVLQRQELQAAKAADCNEVVLCRADGSLMEGLTSNFFAVLEGGTVATAEQGVLHGTVREVVLQLCEREGIRVQLQPPRLDQLPRWQGCFITSTSRLALPVDAVRVLDEEGHLQSHATFPENTIARRMAYLVPREMANYSEKIL